MPAFDVLAVQLECEAKRLENVGRMDCIPPRHGNERVSRSIETRHSSAMCSQSTMVMVQLTTAVLQPGLRGSTHLDLEQVGGYGVAGHGLGERALRGQARRRLAPELGEEVVAERRAGRRLGLDGVHRQRVRHQLYQRGAVAGHQHLVGAQVQRQRALPEDVRQRLDELRRQQLLCTSTQRIRICPRL